MQKFLSSYNIQKKQITNNISDFLAQVFLFNIFLDSRAAVKPNSCDFFCLGILALSIIPSRIYRRAYFEVMIAQR